MRIIELSEQDQEYYNRFVASQPSGSFLQSWEWGEWQAALGRQVYRYKILDNSELQIGSIQLIKMPLPLGKFYLYAPYGPVTNAEFRIQNAKLPFFELKKIFPDAIFLRIEPKDDSAICNLQSAIKTNNIQPAKTLVVNLAQTEEQLLAQMHPKTRYNIRLAQKRGVEVLSELIVVPKHGLYFKEVVEQISQTEKRQKFKGHGQKYYEKLIDFFGSKNQQNDLRLLVYRALYQKRLLASALMMDFSIPPKADGSVFGGGTRTYLFGGSSDEDKNIMAPYLLHWQAILDGKKFGQKFYDFWGIETSGGETPGFAKFKMGFVSRSISESSSGEIKQYPGAWDIVIKRFQYLGYRFFRYLKSFF